MTEAKQIGVTPPMIAVHPRMRAELEAALPVWSRNSNCRKDGQLSRPGIVSLRVARRVFWSDQAMHTIDIGLEQQAKAA
jgi:hypothetical protein